MKTWICPAGSFQGYETENCYQLRSLRYAVSERFGEPLKYCYSKGIHICTDKSPYALQSASQVEEFLFGVDYLQEQQEESCQYLSLTIPKRTDTTGKLPVMVWIHGGAFRNGGCDHDCYDSDLLAAEGQVLVVRINYRLGVLGYVKDKNGSPANLGLLDVIAALHWIRENIESFGGDKENITLFGQSAGAQLIAAILVAEGTDDLFRNVIMQSTPFGAMLGREMMDQKILQELNLMPIDAPRDEVLMVQKNILAHITEAGAAKFMPFAPHYGVNPLPTEDKVEEILKERAAHHSLLIGCNIREVAAYIGNNRVITALDRFPLTHRIVEGILKKKSEEIFINPSKAFAMQYAGFGGQCWYYDFSWSLNNSVLGACHCLELVPLFGGKGLEGRDVLMGLTEKEVCEVGKPLRAIWTEFAKSGQARKTLVEGMLEIYDC